MDHWYSSSQTQLELFPCPLLGTVAVGGHEISFQHRETMSTIGNWFVSKNFRHSSMVIRSISDRTFLSSGGTSFIAVGFWFIGILLGIFFCPQTWFLCPDAWFLCPHTWFLCPSPDGASLVPLTSAFSMSFSESERINWRKLSSTSGSSSRFPELSHEPSSFGRSRFIFWWHEDPARFFL